MEPTIKQVMHIPVGMTKWLVPYYPEFIPLKWIDNDAPDILTEEDYEEVYLFQYETMKYWLGYGARSRTLVIADIIP